MSHSHYLTVAPLNLHLTALLPHPTNRTPYIPQAMPKVTTKDAKVKAAAPDKKRKSKKDKDPNKPKRALSAYMFFVQDYRDRIKSENPDVSFGEVGKLLGAKWKEMSATEKKPYEDQAEADKGRAAQQKKEYEGTGGGAKPKKAAKVAEPEDDDDEDDDDE